MSSETSTKPAEDQGFQVSHFFVLASLIAATVAVVMARPSAPEHLIFISLTIGAAGLAALCFYRMLAPLVAPHSDLDRQPLSERRRLELEREKALTLRSIKELEFDRAMGKVSPEDFELMADRLRARALGIMTQLDAGAKVYRELIEKELAARVGRKSGVEMPAVPASVAAASVATASAAAGATPAGSSPAGPVARGPDSRGLDLQVGNHRCACGTANDPDARFCKSCGAKLQVAS